MSRSFLITFVDTNQYRLAGILVDNFTGEPSPWDKEKFVLTNIADRDIPLVGNPNELNISTNQSYNMEEYDDLSNDELIELALNEHTRK